MLLLLEKGLENLLALVNVQMDQYDSISSPSECETSEMRG